MSIANHKYHKLAVIDGKFVVVPDDHAERHEWVLVRTFVAGVEIRLAVAAYAFDLKASHGEVLADAEGRAIAGKPSRPMTAIEAAIVPDRNAWPSLPKLFFPDIEERWWTWTSTPDAEDPAEYAWAVLLGAGYALRYHRSHRDRVRACCSSQELWDLGDLP